MEGDLGWSAHYAVGGGGEGWTTCLKVAHASQAMCTVFTEIVINLQK